MDQMKDWIYSNRNHSTIINTDQRHGVVYLTFPKLAQAGVCHGFSTRMGGVSEGYLGTMNLSFTRGDDPDKVYENFRRIGEAIGFPQDNLVLSAQIHETRIRIVGEQDKGDGILRPTVPGVDGLVTDVPGIPLYTSYADCVPLLFYDPEHQVIAMAHSGWKGTAAKIGEKMVHFLGDHYGTRPEALIAAIGPSICQACYEVSEDVAEAMRAILPEDVARTALEEKGGGKYQLDLWKTNEWILLHAGILPEHLDVTDLCTCCNSDKLFSHRASHGRRGNMGAFMYLKP